MVIWIRKVSWNDYGPGLDEVGPSQKATIGKVETLYLISVNLHEDIIVWHFMVFRPL